MDDRNRDTFRMSEMASESVDDAYTSVSDKERTRQEDKFPGNNETICGVECYEQKKMEIERMIKMGYSPLTEYVKFSPNKNRGRNHVIDTVTIHCYVGQATVESMGGWFSNPYAECSANYGIGCDGRIGAFVDENDCSWCSSSSSNDNRAVTIECASDNTPPYAINDKVYKALIELCADICKRHGIKKLLWKADKSLIGQPDKQNMTVHRWFDNKACPGDYIYNRLGRIANEVNAKLGVAVTDEPTPSLQATDLKNLSEEEVIIKVGPLFTANQKKSGILASVSLAKFVLESGYGKTELAQQANNCFGMKCVLSNNEWPGSSWDGVTKYRKKTAEQDANGNQYYIDADFRKYPCIVDSIDDHSAYLLGAKNGAELRYDGLKGCTDYRKAIHIIKNGGYATDVKYVDKICDIIERWNLTRYDVYGTTDTPQELPWYRVRKSWSNVASQISAYHNLELAKKNADDNPGYSVFDENGKRVYKGKNKFKPFEVKIEATDLNIRTGPGTIYTPTGEYTGVNILTIVEVQAGPGAKAGWGRLKSGAGWISLDFATRVGE